MPISRSTRHIDTTTPRFAVYVISHDSYTREDDGTSRPEVLDVIADDASLHDALVAREAASIAGWLHRHDAWKYDEFLRRVMIVARDFRGRDDWRFRVDGTDVDPDWEDVLRATGCEPVLYVGPSLTDGGINEQGVDVLDDLWRYGHAVVAHYDTDALPRTWRSVLDWVRLTAPNMICDSVLIDAQLAGRAVKSTVIGRSRLHFHAIGSGRQTG